MAARINASRGGKPDKLFRDALMLEVSRAHKDGEKTLKKINAIAAKLVDRAIGGNEQAAIMIRDSLDGKPAQALALTGDDGGPIQVTWDKS